MASTTLASDAKRPGVLGALGRALHALIDAYRRRQTVHELAALDNHILQDIGVDRAELNASTTVSRDADR